LGEIRATAERRALQARLENKSLPATFCSEDPIAATDRFSPFVNRMLRASVAHVNGSRIPSAVESTGGHPQRDPSRIKRSIK